MDTSTKTKTFDLQLDRDEEHPRRLVVYSQGYPTAHLLTHGDDDGVITGWPAKEDVSTDDDLAFDKLHHYPDDSIRAVAISPDGKRVAVGFDSGSTMIHVYNDLETDTKHPYWQGQKGKVLDGPCFDSPIRDLQFHPSCKESDCYFLAMASESACYLVNVIDQDSIDQGNHWLQDAMEKEHDGSGIRGLAFATLGHNDDINNQKTVLVSLALDGRLCYWNVSSLKSPSDWKLVKRETSACVTKKDPGEILGADPFDRSCRPHFVTTAKNSVLLALPGETYLQLRTIEADTLEVKEWDQPDSSQGNDATGRVKGHIETIVALASHPKDDRYLVTSGRDGRVVAWELQRETNDSRFKACFLRQITECEKPPTDLYWHVDGEKERLLIACVNGDLVSVDGKEHIIPDRRQRSESAEGAPADNSPLRRKVHKEHPNSPGSDNDDGMFSEGSARKNPFLDDEAADDDDDSKDSLAGPNPAKTDASPSWKSPMQSGRHNEDYDSDGDDDYKQFDNHHTRFTPGQKLPEPQPAFAPSSTPLDLARRFMCWNHIGSITLLQGESGVNRSSIDINFTDSAYHRPINFTDNMGFIIGSLGEEGGIFATDLADEDAIEDDEELGEVVEGLAISKATKAALKRSRKGKDGSSAPTGSSVYFHKYETFGNPRQKDWYLTLPDGERALGCACGEGWAAVMTSRRFLRLFSPGGNQGAVVWLKGEPVTMVGRSQYLAVFYHEGAPLLDGTQKLGYLLMDAFENKVISKGSASCISSGGSLSWAGFGNDGSLLAMDSDGMLSMLVNTGSAEGNVSTDDWEWMPMLDTLGLRKSSDDSHWPITVDDGKLICVALKGGVKHPDASRRPVTAALGFRIPFARGALGKSNALEELSVRAGVALKQKRIFHDIASAGEEDEEFEKEFHALSAQVDKVTLKFFASVVEAGKVERALNLVERLNLEKSFDLALKLADNHRKLCDLIEDVKERKFGGGAGDFADEDDYGEDQQAFVDRGTMEPKPSSISPDENAMRKRPLASSGNARAVRQKNSLAY